MATQCSAPLFGRGVAWFRRPVHSGAPVGAGAQELVCKGDRLAYPIRDGIPLMLEEEARELAPEEEIE